MQLSHPALIRRALATTTKKLGRPKKSINESKAFELWLQGESYANIGKKLGVSTGYAYSLINPKKFQFPKPDTM